MKTVLEEKKVCCDCKHFIQHYIFRENGRLHGYSNFITCEYGHCIYPRIKSKKSNQKACEHFAERKENTHE